MAPFVRHIFVCTNQRPANHPRGSCDPSGSLAGLESLVLALGSERKPGRVKLKTGRLDLSAVGSDDRDVEVELALGGHAVDDVRGWLGRRRALVSGRP